MLWLSQVKEWLTKRLTTTLNEKEVIAAQTKRALAAPLSTVRTANARSRHQIERNPTGSDKGFTIAYRLGIV
jgi:hypothetical protein